MKPIIKWVGGKTQILEQLFDNFPREINNYFEPFAGGGSVFLELLERVKNERIVVNGTINIYDKNSVLIHMFLNLKMNYLEVFENLDKLFLIYRNINTNKGNQSPNNEDESLESKESYYYWNRKKYNLMNDDDKHSVFGSALFIFLNKACYRGLYRIGPNGFNVPFGNYYKLTTPPREEFENISVSIQNVNFLVSDFEESLEAASQGDFIYIDPPYIPIKKSSFVNYQSGGFREEDHNRLFESMKNCNTRGVKFLMSNSDTDIIRNSFETFTIKTLTCRRAINSKNPESQARELFVMNYE